MDEQDIPIDINTNKLLDWLVSRRHVNKDWQNNIIKIREKINNAIQDMPAHEGIIKLLSGQHINYFHCLKIIDILKETEADTKNLFGRYGSQRMKDWQDIINSYQNENLYLAEAAQILIRNVNYEVPSLKKQSVKFQQNQLECEKKIKDNVKIESVALNEFNSLCKQLGIPGNNIRHELIELLNELPKLYEKVAKKMKSMNSVLIYYAEFIKYLSGKESEPESSVLLSYIIKNGNTTTYEYLYKEKPVSVEVPQSNINEETKGDSLEIDFGDTIDFGDSAVEQIDWGNVNTDEGFEIVDHDDFNVNLDESGIVIEKTEAHGGVARGEEALTILDNPKTHDQVINELVELEAFLKMRMYEMSAETTDLLSMTQMQDAPSVLQIQTAESLHVMYTSVEAILNELTNKRIQHLHNIKHSPKYVDILTSNLKQKLDIVERIKKTNRLLQDKIKELQEEGKKIEPIIGVIIQNTKLLQKQIENDISKKYKGRPVNIVGGVNML